MHHADTYEKVRKKVPRAEAGSNIDTTASEAEEVIRRKRSDETPSNDAVASSVNFCLQTEFYYFVGCCLTAQLLFIYAVIKSVMRSGYFERSQFN